VILSAALVPFWADEMVAEGIAAGLPEMAIGRMVLAASEIRHYRVTRDRDLGAALVAKVGAWWQRHIVEGVEPDVTSTDATEEWLVRRSALRLAPVRPATADEAALVERWAQADAAAKVAKAAADDLAAQIKNAIGDAEGLETARGKVTWGWQAGRETLDSKALRAAHPKVAAEFTKRGEPFRTLRKGWK